MVACQVGLDFFYFFLGYKGIVHPPSENGGTERTWFVPEHRPRKHFLSDQFKASKMSTLCPLVLTKIPDKCQMCETPALSRWRGDQSTGRILQKRYAMKMLWSTSQRKQSNQTKNMSTCSWEGKIPKLQPPPGKVPKGVPQVKNPRVVTA